MSSIRGGTGGASKKEETQFFGGGQKGGAFQQKWETVHGIDIHHHFFKVLIIFIIKLFDQVTSSTFSKIQLYALILSTKLVSTCIAKKIRDM